MGMVGGMMITMSTGILFIVVPVLAALALYLLRAISRGDVHDLQLDGRFCPPSARAPTGMSGAGVEEA